MVLNCNPDRLRKWEFSNKKREYIQGYYRNYHWVFLHNISCIKNRVVIQITDVSTAKQRTFESQLIGYSITEIAEKGIDDIN